MDRVYSITSSSSSLYRVYTVKHLITSIVNSGLVTLLTSLAMTHLNSTLTLAHWLPNWLVSWFIVCNFVYWIAPVIKGWIYGQQ